MRNYFEGVAAGILCALGIDNAFALAHGKESYLAMIDHDWPSPGRLVLAMCLCAAGFVVFTVQVVINTREAHRGR